MNALMEMKNINKSFGSNRVLEKCKCFIVFRGSSCITRRKWSRKNYDDWLYSEYNHERQRNSKAIWTGNAGRRYNLA